MQEKIDFIPAEIIAKYASASQPKPQPKPESMAAGAVQQAQPSMPTDPYSRAREIAEAIVSSGIDITQGYEQWLTAGMALASDLGESGRSFFHDLSRMNPQYTPEECDKKYNSLLRSSAARPEGAKVHLGSLCKMAKDAGVEMPRHERAAGSQHGGSCAPHTPCANLAKMAKTENDGAASSASDGCEKRQFGANYSSGENGSSDDVNNVLNDDIDRNKPSTFTDLLKQETLPRIVQEAIALATDSETNVTDIESADINTIGIVTLASSIMPNVFGIYDRQKVHPPLYAMCVAPPASSKGQITPMREFVMPVQDEIRQDNMREITEYKKQKSADKILHKDNPEHCSYDNEPPYRSLFVPANSSSTATYQALNDNGGTGLTFETEGSVMAEALKSDYGNYLAGLCAAFHHEPITYNRRKEKEHVDIRYPCWTVFLTGYPEMVRSLVPDAHTGLFSRFLFYWRGTRLVWRNVFADDSFTLNQAYADMGSRFLPIYHLLAERKPHPVRFTLSDGQKEMFNTFFERLQAEQYAMLGDDIIASVRRLGLITFRIAMVLTVLHLADGDTPPDSLPDELTCADADFITAMTMVNKLLNHTTKIYAMMLDHDMTLTFNKRTPLSAVEHTFFRALPDHFDRATYEIVAKRLNIAKRTAQRYVSRLINEVHLVERVKTGVFRKI